MKFVKLEDSINAYKSEGFKCGDNVIALLSNGDVKHGELFFVTDYKSIFEVQLIIDQTYGKTLDLFGASVCRIEF